MTTARRPGTTTASGRSTHCCAPMLIDRPEVQTAVLHSDIATDMLAGLDGSGLTGVGILPGQMSIPGGHQPPADRRRRLPGRGGRDATQRRRREMVDGTGRRPSGVRHPRRSGSRCHRRLRGRDDDRSRLTWTTSITTQRRVRADGRSSSSAIPRPWPRSVSRTAHSCGRRRRSSIDIKAGNDQTDAAEAAAALCRSGTVAFDNADPGPAGGAARQRGTGLSVAAGGRRHVRLPRPHPADRPMPRPWIRRAAAALDCPATAPTSNHASAATDGGCGTHHHRVTRRHLHLQHDQGEAEAAGLPPENWGEWVAVLGRGRFATTQPARPGLHLGLRPVLDRRRHHQIATTRAVAGWRRPTPSNKPGEEFGFHWSLYRDVLTLTNQPDVSLAPARGAQWESRPGQHRTGPLRPEPAVPATRRGIPES